MFVIYRAFLYFLLLSAILLVSACMPAPLTYAPVHAARTGVTPYAYRVKRGDTLYSIAFAYGLDYRELARRNRLGAPYRLSVGQRLNIKSQPRSRKHVRAKPAYPSHRPKKTIISRRKSRPRLSKPYKRRDNTRILKWYWPAKGRVAQGFAPNRAKKGIDIAGKRGEPVYSTAAGRVAYAGRGLKGYGRLIIIKHNNTFLSAYAYNKRILVKESQWVKAGQRIALMGSERGRQGRLHFEIRKSGRPVDPRRYLPRR